MDMTVLGLGLAVAGGGAWKDGDLATLGRAIITPVTSSGAAATDQANAMAAAKRSGIAIAAVLVASAVADWGTGWRYAAYGTVALGGLILLLFGPAPYSAGGAGAGGGGGKPFTQ